MNTFVLFKIVMTLRPSKTLSNVKDIFHSKVNNILKSEKIRQSQGQVVIVGKGLNKLFFM